MRCSPLLLSLAVHGAVVAAALGLGVYASTSAWRPPARIGLAEDRPAPQATTSIELPQVVVEREHVVEPLRDVVVEAPVEPATETGEQAAGEQAAGEQAVVVEAVRPTRTPTLARVRKAARPAEAASAPAANDEPVVSHEPPQVAGDDAAQATTDAVPLDDNEPPRYPERERRRGREGNVVVAAVVDEHGSVVDVSLRKPSRHPAFNREALRAVRGWRFEPAQLLGVAVASETEVTVVFRLKD